MRRSGIAIHKTTMTTPSANWKHLHNEIALLKLCLLHEVRRLTQESGEKQPDHFRGLVLSEQEILSILTDKPDGAWEDFSSEIRKRIEELDATCIACAQSAKSPSTLQRLSEIFDLSRIEQQCLILCLAAEIEPKYARVYAFLQDDITRKLPVMELALRLFRRTPEERVEARVIFSPQAALRRNKLIQFQDIQDLPGSLSQRWMKLDERIAAFLLETPGLDSSLSGWVEYQPPGEEKSASLSLSDELCDRTAKLAHACFAGGEAKVRPILHLYGKYGAGKRELAEHVCGLLGLPLLLADAARIPSSCDRQDAWWRLGRESLLQPAAIFVDHFDDLLEESRAAERNTFMDAAGLFSPLTFLAGNAPWKGIRHTHRKLFLSLECQVPDMLTRMAMWKQILGQVRHDLSGEDIAELSSKFRFTGGQVGDAFSAAHSRAVWISQPPPPLGMAIMNQACRSQATPNLGQLARRIEPAYGWNDIILPDDLMAQLREIATHVKRSQVVLEQWGFESKFPYGQGVTGLFHGGSGTGKTMAVSIVAADLELDLYKIDLSMVVSEYIGETEKNLNRVFAEAQASNAILFFDEADALFGKRSEVKDAHDRYANIETAYLLQRMEEYSGVVILASNMKHNLDEAFVRRMRFILHFPFPNEEERERIWRGAFPQEAPLGEDVDFSWLARKLKITGGYIKNISLRAAFLAADRKGVISMDCLKEAAKLEMEKIGKITDLATFQPATEPHQAKDTAQVEVA